MKVALEFVSNITKFHKEFSHIDIVYVLFTLKVTAILIHSMHGFKSLPSHVLNLHYPPPCIIYNILLGLVPLFFFKNSLIEIHCMDVYC